MSWLDDLLGFKDVFVDSVLASPRRKAFNLIPGSNVAIVAADDAANGRTNITISSTAGGGGLASDYKDSVTAASSAALPAYTRVGDTITANANGVLAAQDGVTLTVGARRLLFWHGAAGADNGTYDVVQMGDAGTPWILRRTVDGDGNTETFSDGTRVTIAEGTLYAGRTFKVTTNDPITPNVTPLTFALDTGLPDGTSVGQVPRWDGTTWTPGAANLADTDAVTGILGLANGGTNVDVVATLARTEWYIDAAAGNDANTGAIGSPLATFAEFQRRMRGQILTAEYTVYVTGGQDHLTVDFDIGDGGWIDIIFAPTVGPSYTIAAFTAANPASTTEVEKIQTVAAGTAAGLIGKRIRFTSGPASNCTAWATRALSGYDDRTFELTKPYSFTKANGTWLQATPAAPNTFVEETLPVVGDLSVHIRRHGGQGFCFAIRNAQFGTSGSPVQDPIFALEGWGYTVGCAWYANGFQTDGYHVSDAFKQGGTIRGLATPIDKARFIGCYFYGNQNLSDVVILNSLFKHGAVGIEAGEVHLLGLVGIMCEVADAVAAALWIFNGACRLVVNTNGEPDGYLLIHNATAYGIKMPAGAQLDYTVKPIVVNSGAYALVGEYVVATSADVPHVDPATAAAFVAGQLGSIG